jgi:hypothetical protein
VFRRRNYQTKDDATGGAEEEIVYGVLVGELRKQTKFSLILKTAQEGMEHIHVTQNRDKWRASINRLINFRVPSKTGFSRRNLLQE